MDIYDLWICIQISVFSLMDIQILCWFCRYSNVLIRLINICRRYISMDIYAPQAPAQERRAHQCGHWGGPGSWTWGTAQEFVAPLSRRLSERAVWRLHTVEHRQKRSAGHRRLQRDEGPRHNFVPRLNGEKRPRLPESNKTSFFMRPIRDWNQVFRCRASRNSFERRIYNSAMLDSRVFVVFGTNTAERSASLVALNTENGCCIKYRYWIPRTGAVEHDFSDTSAILARR